MAEVQDSVRVVGMAAAVLTEAGRSGPTLVAAPPAPVRPEPMERGPVESRAIAFPARTTALVQRPLNWSAPSPVAEAVALKTAAELAQTWADHRGLAEDVPRVDFEQSMVLGVFAGEGFSREVPSIERVKLLADEVVVYVSRFSRPWSKHNAKAVVEVPRQTLPVRFVYLS